MQEFSSISVSSYEAGALAGKLTEQSGDGWSVVAIVPTGSTVTAYLSRPAGSKPAEPTDVATATGAAKPDAATSDETKPDETKPDETKPDESKPDESKPDEAKPDESKPDEAKPAAGSSEHVTPALPEREATGSPVDEPAGWALQPEPANAGSAGAAAAGTATPTATPAASTTAATTAAAAPAGWYADPSSRYDLRYWDGSQWTEHVSRGGQQFSDPPVA